MKIDLSELGEVQTKVTSEKRRCWVCQDLLGYENRQGRYHANRTRTDRVKLDAKMVHDELLSQEHTFVGGGDCPLGCGGQIVTGKVLYNNVRGNDWIGVTFRAHCNKCKAETWEPFHGKLSFDKAKELGVKYED